MESVWLQAIMDAVTAVQSMAPKGVMRRLMRVVRRTPLEMLRMPDTMAYPIRFGDAKRAYPWSVLADFIRIARAQYPQPA